MAPRGLSAEEKRVKLLEIFHESKDFYQLKELEKLGPKLKGVVSQSVKEILSGLVDDGLVMTDKIGSSNFFWSFPSHNTTTTISRLSALRTSLATSTANLEFLRASLAHERTQRTPHAAETLRFQALTSQLASMDKELAAYGTCDPALVETKRRAIVFGKEAAVRATENYSAAMGYFLRTNGMVGGEEIRAYLEVEEDYEDLE